MCYFKEDACCFLSLHDFFLYHNKRVRGSNSAFYDYKSLQIKWSWTNFSHIFAPKYSSIVEWIHRHLQYEKFFFKPPIPSSISSILSIFQCFSHSKWCQLQSYIFPSNISKHRGMRTSIHILQALQKGFEFSDLPSLHLYNLPINSTALFHVVHLANFCVILNRPLLLFSPFCHCSVFIHNHVRNQKRPIKAKLQVTTIVQCRHVFHYPSRKIFENSMKHMVRLYLISKRYAHKRACQTYFEDPNIFSILVWTFTVFQICLWMCISAVYSTWHSQSFKRIMMNFGHINFEWCLQWAPDQQYEVLVRTLLLSPHPEFYQHALYMLQNWACITINNSTAMPICKVHGMILPKANCHICLLNELQA